METRFVDVVFPNGNEKEFIAVAEKLAIPAMLLTYPFTDQKSFHKCRERVKQLQTSTKVSLNAAAIAEDKHIYKAKDANIFAIAKANGDEAHDRELIAKYQPALIFNVESAQRKDYVHSRRSGLNQVLCKFAQKNRVIIAVPFSTILHSKNQPELLGRMLQNARFMNKYDVQPAIASFASDPHDLRSPRDLHSFLLSFGFNTKKAKEAMESIAARL
jgi:hypothetical protein